MAENDALAGTALEQTVIDPDVETETNIAVVNDDDIRDDVTLLFDTQTGLSDGVFNGDMNQFVGYTPLVHIFNSQSVAPHDIASVDTDVYALAVTSDKTAPKVSSFSPTDGGKNVDPGTGITITFNEAVKAGSGVIELRSGSATGTVVESFDVATSSNLTFSGSVLTIDPTSDLTLGTRYYVTIAKKVVTDLAGNSYAGTTSYDFTTIPGDTTAPKVSSFNPTDGGKNVDPGTGITITFSEAVKAGTGVIELRSGSATGTVVESFDVATSSNLGFSGSVLTIDPTSDLTLGTRYYVTITKNVVTDLAGNSYAGTTSYDFTTIPGDTTAPKVSSFSPTDGGKNVDPCTGITITFNEAVKAGTGVIELRSGSASGTVVESFDVATSSNLSFSGSVLTIDPTSDLGLGTRYYVKIVKNVVTDLAGNSYAGTTSYDFTTTTTPVDGTAPETIAFSPADGSEVTEVATDITVTFSEAIKAGSGVIELRSGSATGTVVESFDVATSGNLSFSGSVLTIDPTADLASATHYYVTLGSGSVTDLAGNSYAGTATYDFTTTTAVDGTAPDTIAFSPADGSVVTDVATDITVTFSEAVKAGSGVIELRSGSATGTVVESFDVVTSSNLTFSGSVLTIDPTADLASGAHYYVTLGSGSVTDLAGNSYAGTTTYDFLTAIDTSSWSSVSGHGLLDIDAMLEMATGQTISDAALYGDGTGSWDWGINKVQAQDGWAAGYTGEGIIVAVIDTGVEYTHSDLAGNIWINTDEIEGNGVDDDGNGYVDDLYGYDFVNSDGYALDDNGHGTHVAGIIAGLQNGAGVTGIAFDSTIMAIKVLNSSGSGSFTNVANGIYYAVDNGADVINMSLGAYGASSSAVTTAVNYAVSHGVVVSMASGNDSETSPGYPAILAQSSGGIAVGAVNSSNTIASFSNGAGTTLPYDYVETPGVSIYSTYKGGGYASMSGTSMAAPYAAGAAALLLSAEADYTWDWTLEQLENILTTTATSLTGTALAATGDTSSTVEAASSADVDVESGLILTGFYETDVADGEVLMVEHIGLSGVMTGVDSGYEVFMV